MILPLTLPPPKSSSPNPGSPALPSALARLGSSEFVLLELQGQLEVSGTKHGQLVGRLTIDDDGDKGKPTLRIGHHLLEGKIVSLPKPLALLQRVCTPLPSSPPPPSSSNLHLTPSEDEDRDNGDGDGDVDMRDPHTQEDRVLQAAHTNRRFERKDDNVMSCDYGSGRGWSSCDAAITNKVTDRHNKPI